MCTACRYKQLLLKQRDIMIALTARLNERDEQIMTLQVRLSSVTLCLQLLGACAACTALQFAAQPAQHPCSRHRETHLTTAARFSHQLALQLC
jgi:hypothetical protein